MISQEFLKSQLRYDTESGHFYRLVTRGGKSRGTIAGTLDSLGYIAIEFAGRTYKAHRLAWFYMTGEWPPNVDHKDRVKNNNKWNNLRGCTPTQNIANSKLSSFNTSGAKGVYFNRASGKWTADIRANGIRTFLGYHKTFEEAKKVRREAAERIFGEFARHE